jgi:hypothetical protein
MPHLPVREIKMINHEGPHFAKATRGRLEEREEKEKCSEPIQAFVTPQIESGEGGDDRQECLSYIGAVGETGRNACLTLALLGRQAGMPVFWSLVSLQSGSSGK